MPDLGRDPFEEILELELKLQKQKEHHDGEIVSLRKEITELRESIKELIDLIIAVKGFVRSIGYFEKVIVFCTKFAAWAGGIYVVYKFGIQEIADKVKTVMK